MVRIPLNTTVAPTGTLRLILRGGRVEVHYQIDGADHAIVTAVRHPPGRRGQGLHRGADRLRRRASRPRPRRAADRRVGPAEGAQPAPGQAAVDRQPGRPARRPRQGRPDRPQQPRHRQAGPAGREVARRGCVRRSSPPCTRWSTRPPWSSPRTSPRPSPGATRGPEHEPASRAWTEGRHRRGAERACRSAEVLRSCMVNAAYTSQVGPASGALGRACAGTGFTAPAGSCGRQTMPLRSTSWQRVGDPDITLHTPHQRVKQILQERADRHRTRLPIQDSSRPDGGERNIRTSEDDDNGHRGSRWASGPAGVNAAGVAARHPQRQVAVLAARACRYRWTRLSKFA